MDGRGALVVVRKVVRGLAGFNALFQVAVGLLSVLSPHLAAAAFKVDIAAPAMAALIRMFGGLLASTGILSALIAQNPDRDRGFTTAFIGCLFLNVGADVIVIFAGELRFDQLAVGMILELVLGILMSAYAFGRRPA